MKSSKGAEIIRTEVREKDGFEYKYTLTLSRGRRVASYGIPLYSVAIEMRASSDSRESRGDAEDLFSDLSRASDFFDMIVDNLATPIDLPYIVEDELTR